MTMQTEPGDVAVDVAREAVELQCPSCRSRNRVPLRRLADKAVCGSCREALVVASPLNLDDKSFDAVIRSSPLPVLVDCWAPWCGPCQMVGPELAWIAQHRAGEVLVAKVDADENPGVAARYGIRSIPTLMLFSKGELIKRQAGAMNRGQIQAAFL